MSAASARSRSPELGRGDRQLLVGLHRLHEAAHPGLERRLRQHLGALPRDSRRDLDDRRVRQVRQGLAAAPVAVPHVDDLDVAAPVVQRRDELRRRLGVERAAAALEQLRLLVEVRVAVHVEELALDVDHLRGPRLAAVELVAQDLVERVVVLEVVARDRARQAHQLGRRADVVGDSVRLRLEDLGQPIDPVDLDGAIPRQVVEAHVLELDALRARPRISPRTGAGTRSRRCTARSLDGRRRAAPG